uniref:Plastocyanin n=1 Tax=uncultured marine group II/III euryarchaeote KM3_195_B08 TaxID=1457970 RepID=A0A075GUZ2_9EURY|nr:Plastocyanin [uncultured marine group II/III euryarchaeote KM3_195_B08]
MNSSKFISMLGILLVSMVFFSGCIGTPETTPTTVETPAVEETTEGETTETTEGETTETTEGETTETTEGETTETTEGETTETTEGETTDVVGHELGPITHLVEITANGFNPNSLTVSAGDAVSFVNQDSSKHWPASDVHPTHGTYPESGGCIGSTFDSCAGLEQNENYLFTFDEVGSWSYHDHLNPSLTGKVVVE